MNVYKRLYCSSCIAIFLVPAVWAGEGDHYDLNIEAQELSAALETFAKQSGLQVVYFASVAGDARTSGVSGSYTADAALNELLRETDLVHTAVDDRTYSVGVSSDFSGNAFESESVHPESARAQTTLMATVVQTTQGSALNQGGNAAGNESDVLEEIIVKSRRRPERLQDVPDSVTVLTTEFLENTGVRNFVDAASHVPNFSFFEDFKPGSVFITMRGIPTAEGGDPPVTIVVDGVQVPSIDFINQNLFDLESVEVLRGPQGAIYGRGAIGGAIIINTRQPSDEFTARGLTSFADGDDFRASGSISGALVSDKVYYSLAAAVVDRDGLIFDTGLNDYADFVSETTFRGHLKFYPTEDLSIDLRGKHIDGEAGGSMQEMITANQLTDFSVLPARNLLTQDDRKISEWSVQLEQMSDIGMFTAVLGYGDQLSTFTGDGDQTADISGEQLFIQDVQSYTVDVRYTSPEERRVRWVVGGFFQNREKETTFELYGDPGITPALEMELGFGPGEFLFGQTVVDESDAFAAYGQAMIDLTDNLELTLALRYDQDDRSNVDLTTPGSDISHKFSETQPKFSLAYRWGDDTTVYFTYGRGYLSGGFNSFQEAQNAQVARIYDSSVTDNVEIGLKYSAPDGKWYTSLSAYLIDFQNQHFFITDVLTGGIITNRIIAIDETEIFGIEAEFHARPIDGLDLNVSVGTSDSTIVDFDGTGRFNRNSSPKVYPYTLNVGAEYTHQLSNNYAVTTRIDYEKRGPIYHHVSNRDRFPSTDFVNFRLGFGPESGRWSVAGFAKNLTDELTASFFGQDFFDDNVNARLRTQPRQYGVEFRVDF